MNCLSPIAWVDTLCIYVLIISLCFRGVRMQIDKKLNSAVLWQAVLMGMVTLCLPVKAQNQSSPFELDPISEGFILHEGQYLEPPYHLAWADGLFSIDDLPIQLPRFDRFPKRAADDMKRGRKVKMPPGKACAWIRRRLTEQSVLFCWTDRPAVFLKYEQGMAVLTILNSDMSQQEKKEVFTQAGVKSILPQQRRILVDQFVRSEALNQRLHATMASPEGSQDQDDEEWYSEDGLIAMTASGFILAVYAFGTLVRARSLSASMSASVLRAESVKLLALVAILNLYDLISTLVAHGTGGLWELNPFAGHMLDQTTLVVVYKVGLTVGAVLLLFVTRRFRLAQLVTYWAAVLYTVLIMRWITYNSMFL